MADPALNYRLVGSGPPLLLVHGFGVTFNIWRELVPLLADHFSLVMIELPGIGHSPSPDDGPHEDALYTDASYTDGSYTEASITAIESVRQKLAIPKWSVLAYSISVGVAAAYSVVHPDRTEKLMLLCPPLLTGWRWRGLRTMLWLDKRWPVIGDWFFSGGWPLYGLVALVAFNRRPTPLTREWVDEISAQPYPLLKAILREFVPVDRLLEQVGDNALLLCGSKDFVSSRPPAQRVRVAWFSGDHSGPVRVARPIAEAVVEFLKR